MTAMRDIYQDENGTAPWLRPWRDDKSGNALEPYNATTGRPYNGINLLILGSKPYAGLGWLTYNQARELGGNVRKGEHGTLIVFWKFEAREDEATGKSRVVPFARGYTVFNLEQCENVDAAKLKHPQAPAAGGFDVNAIAATIGAVVRHGGNRAFYSPSADFVQLPSLDAFRSPEHYQATLAHELTHWTGHEKRCHREFGGWLKILKADKRAIFTAASKAKEAAAFILADREEEAVAA